MPSELATDFDAILEEVLERLPPEFSECLDEVPIIVEDEPSESALRDLGIELTDEPSDLCGMHWGIPLSERSVAEPMGVTPQIFIYRGPIARLAGKSRRSLAKQIRITLLHELGHHLGLTEDRLEELGYG